MNKNELVTAESRPIESSHKRMNPIDLSFSNPFAAHKDVIVRASESIRDYEAYLRNSEILLEFKLEIPRDHEGSNRAIHDECAYYSIRWGSFPNQDGFRLYYSRYIRRCEFAGTEYGLDDFDDMRPLIEAPLAIRVYLRGWLPRFNKVFSDYLESVEFNCELPF